MGGGSETSEKKERAAVQSEEIYELAVTLDLFSSTGTLHTPKHPVWTQFSKALQNRMSPKYCWQYLHDDRKSICTRVRNRLQIQSPDSTKQPMEDEDSSEEESSSMNGESDESLDEEEKKVLPICNFMTTIPRDVWEEIKPAYKLYRRSDRVSGFRKVLFLKPKAWTSKISELLWKQHELPCSFAFKRNTVVRNPDITNNYVTIEGKCTDEACKATAVGAIKSKPLENEPVTLHFKTRDTRKVQHIKKRQCRGEERLQIQKDIKHLSATVFRRKRAASEMNGNQEPPNLYSKHVYRKIKHEGKKKDLNLPPKKKRRQNEIDVLQEMKYEQPFVGSIHCIGADPIEIVYQTPTQSLLFNTLCKSDYCKIEIDATGSLIRRDPDEKQTKKHSKHLFLYEIVVTAGEEQVPVFQAISERQDAVIITKWLADLLRNDSLTPNEAVCDDSKALLSALSRTFAGCSSLQHYLEMCFLNLQGESDQLPNCFLRKDLAHYINAMRKWKVWSSVKNNITKAHFMRFMGLLIKSETLKDFEDRLLDILTLSMAETIGSCPAQKATSAESSRIRLAKLVSGLDTEDFSYSKTEETEHNEEFDGLCDGETAEESLQENNGSVRIWLDEIWQRATIFSKEEGDQINPYHSHALANNFKNCSKDFVLWTAVMVEKFHSPYLTASSAGVESDFSDLKSNILRGIAGPLPLSEFVALHLNDILGHVNLAAYSLKHLSHTAEKPGSPKQESETEDGNENQTENNSKNKEDKTSPTKSPKMQENLEGNKENKPEKSVKNSLGSTFKNHPTDRNKKGDRENGRVLTVKNNINAPNKSGKAVAENELNSDDEEKNEYKWFEDWRGLGRGDAKKSKESKYLADHPEILFNLENHVVNEPKENLLKNGNLTGYHSVDGKTKLQVRNTCSFDSVTQILARGIIESPVLREAIKNKKGDVPCLEVAWMLSTEGAKTCTYLKRAETVSPHGNLTLANTVQSQRTKAVKDQSLAILQYDLYGNLEANCKKFFNGFWSKTTTWRCPQSHLFETGSVMIDPNTVILRKRGMFRLQEAILRNISNEKRVCQNESCKLTSHGKVSLQSHVLLETGFLKAQEKYSLSDFPVILLLSGNFYRLVGVVAHEPGHYTAFIRHAKGKWEKFDGLAKHSYFAKLNTSVKPEAIMYVRFDFKKEHLGLE